MIEKVLAGMGNSRLGQKFFNWASQPKNEKFLNHTLPQAETVIATSCYVISTARQKDIEEDQKELLQIQNVASGVVGLLVSTVLSKKMSNFGEQVIENLDSKKVGNVEGLKTGIRIGTPIVTTMAVMRCLVPGVIALFSGKLMDREREKRKEKLDYNA